MSYKNLPTLQRKAAFGVSPMPLLVFALIAAMSFASSAFAGAAAKDPHQHEKKSFAATPT